MCKGDIEEGAQTHALPGKGETRQTRKTNNARQRTENSAGSSVEKQERAPQTNLHAVRKKLDMASQAREIGHTANIIPVCVSPGQSVYTACRKYLTQYKAMTIRKVLLVRQLYA